MRTLKQKITLNETETKIINLLKHVIHHFKLKTQLRIAGGWVRDKLLGEDCNDIDFAVDNMMGREFCDKINEFRQNSGLDVLKISVFPRNPEQCKHLETAKMSLFDVEIEFTNLRAEAPTKKFGSPKEDANRRDLTINSLFYNIHSNSVEDFTKRGITDLILGKIVTPLEPPKETFLDDPLRVLRAIRFGARFNFELDEGLKEAAASDEVRAAFTEKISRERIGKEVDLMIGGNGPVQAVTYICDVQLFWVVFKLPANVKLSSPEACARHCQASMDTVLKLIQSLEVETLNLNDGHRRLCLYAALFLPLKIMFNKDNKKEKIPDVDFILRTSLKLEKHAELVNSVYRATQDFVPLISSITSETDVRYDKAKSEKILIDVPDSSKLQILIGLLLREIKDLWPVVLLVSILIRLYPDSDLHESLVKKQKLVKGKELFNLVKDVIFKLDLQNIWNSKPLLNGDDIMDILYLNSGPTVGVWCKKVIQWQLGHPTGTRDECEEWLKEAGGKSAETDGDSV